MPLRRGASVQRCAPPHRPDRSEGTTSASAVNVRRSPPAQPSAVMTARSQIRPEASMRAIPYTTSSGADGTGTGEASGSRRDAAGLAHCRDAGTPEEGMAGARGCAVTAASPGGRQGRPRRGRQRRRHSNQSDVREGDFPPEPAPEAPLCHAGQHVSPGRENAPPRVQVVAEPGKMRVSVRWRWDLNPRRGCPLTRFRGVRPRPLGDSTAAELT